MGLSQSLDPCAAVKREPDPGQRARTGVVIRRRVSQLSIDFGNVDSARRANIWDQVVAPLASMALTHSVSLPYPPIPRSAWMAYTRPVQTDYLTAAYSDAKQNAMQLAVRFGVSFSLSSSMDMYAKAIDMVAQLAAAAAPSTGAQPGAAGSSGPGYNVGSTGSDNYDAGPMTSGPSFSENTEGYGYGGTDNGGGGNGGGGGGNGGGGNGGGGNGGGDNGGNGDTTSSGGGAWILALLLLMTLKK